ncbi:MAG: heparinase II/III family protein [Kiritimatiellae bacterium]|nr:heparinase II/III family protein [Kiritimatiellia bacterium]
MRRRTVRRSTVFLLLSVSLVRTGAAAGIVRQGPATSRSELLAALDLELPELAAVQQAVRRGDEREAATALVRHLRTRSRPRWPVDPFAVGHSTNASVSRARAVLRNRFESIGIVWQFGETVDWGFNPTTQPDSRWAANHEWTWQLNRHRAWLDLASAYYETGDEQYARKLAELIRDWIRSCPPPTDRADNGPGSKWRTIEAGIRCGTIWPAVWPRVLASRSFDEETWLLWLASWVDHARYLMRFKTSGNWLTMEANGLYHVGALFPEFRDAALWRAAALERLAAELDAQVYPDGAQIELAPGYHSVSLCNFLGPVESVSRTGFEVPPGYVEKLERMYDYLLSSMQPTRRMPPFNDSSEGDVARYFETAVRLFPHRRDFRWLWTDGREGEPPPAPTRCLRYAGQVFFRSGWERDAVWLGFDAGPFGYGHQHEDKLNVILTAYGAPLLVEGGVYTYDASIWRRWVLSSRAHNVVLMDGLEQNRRKSPRQTWVVREPVALRFATNAEVAVAEAAYDEGWGREARRLAVHRRRVVHLLPDLFVVHDRLTPMDTTAHRYEALFHLDAADAVVSGLWVRTVRSGPNLSLVAYGADRVDVIRGQTNPVVLGWLPAPSRGYGAMRPIPTVVFQRVAEGPVELTFVLRPAPAETVDPPPRSVRVAEQELEIELADGRRRAVRWEWSEPPGQ